VNNPSVEGREQMLHEALTHLQSALELLDRAAAPGQIGAQLDHVLHQLGSLVSSASRPEASQIVAGIVRH
jgi:hypothetical protein